VELVRVLLAEKSGDSHPEYIDPLAECARILEVVMRLPEAQGFRYPVDPKLDNGNDNTHTHTLTHIVYACIYILNSFT
jgi:hypothetical protein